MARLAPIQIAGILAAMVMCAAAATEALAQEQGCESGRATVCDNRQTYDARVIASLNLNVTIDDVKVEVDPTEGSYDTTDRQITTTASATGNSLSAGAEGVSLDVRNAQTMNGNANARTNISTTVDIGPVINATTQTTGNSLAGGAYGGDFAIDSDQRVGPSEITASTEIRGGTARLLSGANVTAAATGNAAALAGNVGVISGSVHQVSDASVRAENLAETQYIPAAAVFGAQAIGNAAAVNGLDQSGQSIYIGQRSTGDVVTANTSANAGNAWDLTGASVATANQAVIANQGGSVVARTQQENFSQVASTAVTTSYDYGRAVASAEGSANAVSVGNNDKYLELDNSQLNSGGVEVQASFVGAQGYDVYVSANAVGNSVTGYACAECQATLNATNNQTNDGNVSASANTTISSANRNVITGSNAVGNAATFYVSRPGQ